MTLEGFRAELLAVMVVQQDGKIEWARQLEVEKVARPGDILFYPPYVSCGTFGDR